MEALLPFGLALKLRGEGAEEDVPHLKVLRGRGLLQPSDDGLPHSLVAPSGYAFVHIDDRLHERGRLFPEDDQERVGEELTVKFPEFGYDRLEVGDLRDKLPHFVQNRELVELLVQEIVHLRDDVQRGVVPLKNLPPLPLPLLFGEDLLDGRDDGVDILVLHDVVVGADLVGPELVRRFGFGGQDDDRNRPGHRIGLEDP